MKRFLALLALATTGAVVYVATATGSAHTGSVVRQLAVLRHEVAAMRKQLNGVTKQARLEAQFIVRCLGFEAAGLTRYGDPSGGAYGYAYTDAQGHTAYRTALDLSGPEVTNSDLVVVATRASCGREMNRSEGLDYLLKP